MVAFRPHLLSLRLNNCGRKATTIIELAVLSVCAFGIDLQPGHYSSWMSKSLHQFMGPEPCPGIDVHGACRLNNCGRKSTPIIKLEGLIIMLGPRPQLLSLRLNNCGRKATTIIKVSLKKLKVCEGCETCIVRLREPTVPPCWLPTA